MSHWYKATETGFEPCYEVPKKSGNGMKRVTITEARELKLLPSVTTILQVLAKPGLQTWLHKQHILAALRLPRNPNESDDDYCERVMVDADSVSKKARDLGTEIHEELSQILHGHTTLNPYLYEVQRWIKNEVIKIHSVEKVVGNEFFGFAGRLDLLCETKSYGRSVVDFKTQGIKRIKGIKTPAIYPEFGFQLQAYAHCIGECNLINVIIDTSEPGPVFCHQWNDDCDCDLNNAWNIFLCCLRIWSHLNKYDPGLKAPEKSSHEEPTN